MRTHSFRRGSVAALALGLLFAVPATAILPDVEPKAKPKAAKPADVDQRPATGSTLVLKSNADCALKVNGTSMGQLKANETRAVKVPPGDQLVECRSQGGALAQTTRSVANGAQAVVELSLQSQERATTTGGTGRFTERGDEVVDSQTGLQWTRSDNGTDINWRDAESWCSARGGGWRQPTVDELLSLYDASGGLSTRCGRFTCRVSPRFNLTNIAVWSGDREGSSKAWHVDLGNGLRFADDVGVTSLGSRALCVRRS